MERPPLLVYSETASCAAVSDVVDCYWSIRGEAGVKAAPNRVLPDGCMDIIFALGPESAQPAYVVGAMRQAVVVRHTGPVDLLGVRFRPGRAATFLGVPATDLTGEIAGLDAFWSDAGSLRDELALLRPSALREGGGEGVRPVASRAERRLLAERAAVLDRVLLARIGSREPDGLVAGALQLIRESQGCMRVREIERRLGTSERTLGRRFGAAVGLSPKESSRIARFLMVARRLDREPQTGLARLAFGAGYADQSHFTRDFADLAGITPAAYAREPSVTRGLAG